MENKGKAISVLTANTTAFAVCFAAWMMNGILITYLSANGVYDWTYSEIGWLISMPVLSGALLRLPVGYWSDKFGGKYVYMAVMLLSALMMYFVSFADSFYTFLFGGLGFGIAGTSFAVGIAYSSVWFPKERQGTALGIFGAGNAGAAATTLIAPGVLAWLTDGGENMSNWIWLPRMYAMLLVGMTVIFFFFTFNKIPEGSKDKTFRQRMQPLKKIQVWRFGLYYFFVFGGFVALSQWLVPYYVNVYYSSVAVAGLLASIYILPSGLIRALGGWISDKLGARRAMYWVFGVCLVCCGLLVFPKMEAESPGRGIMAKTGGTVTEITAAKIVIKNKLGKNITYSMAQKSGTEEAEAGAIFPHKQYWQEPVTEIPAAKKGGVPQIFKVGAKIKKKTLIAKGVTQITFEASIIVFTMLVFIIGIFMGFGKAAVYKHIPDYFPNDVGVVGGIVGVLGGLGGFICPIIFGYLLDWSGLWTTCWMFFFALIGGSTFWMHHAIKKHMKEHVPDHLRHIGVKDQKLESVKN